MTAQTIRDRILVFFFSEWSFVRMLVETVTFSYKVRKFLADLQKDVEDGNSTPKSRYTSFWLADVGVRVEVEHANFARFPNRRPPVDVLRNHQSIFLETRHFSPFLTKLQSVPDSKPHLRTPTHHTNDGYKIRSQCLQCLQLLGM